MSVQLELLKSGEVVIADIKEYRDSDDKLISYLFKDPYIVKVKTSQVLVEEKGTPKHEVVYYKWMSLSKDDDVIVNKDWVVCITDPLDTIKTSYEERMNGRDRSTDRRDGATTRRSESGGEGESDTSAVSDEQLKTGLTD